MKKPRSLKQQIIAGLGRTWMHWSPRNEVKKRCKIENKTGWYRCELCHTEREKLEIDHITPVVSVVDGFTDWNTYIKSRFVTADKLQGICRDCHKNKTKEENKKRRELKKWMSTNKPYCQHDDSSWCTEECSRGKIL